MRKLWNIAYKDLRITYSDRNLLLIMLAAPLVLVAIIGVTFGNVFGSSAAPITHIPVAVVNLDEGSALNFTGAATDFNYGDILTDLLVRGTVSQSVAEFQAGGSGEMSVGGVEMAEFDCPESTASAAQGSVTTLDELIDGTRLSSVDGARRAVENGQYAAAVIIPPDFSSNLQITPAKLIVQPVSIEIYGSPERPIAVEIVRSVVDQTATQFASGNVTLAALISSLPSNPLQIAAVISSPAFSQGIACAFTGAGSNIIIERQMVGGGAVQANPLVFIGAAQAIFFALFTANGQASSIIEERRDGTLQRLLVTPTPSIVVLAGKILAIFVVVLLQLFLLTIGLTVLASVLTGEVSFIWGDNLLAIAAVLLATALATSGIGTITAAVAKNVEQAGTIGGIVAIFSAVLGGAFGFTLPSVLSNLSVVYWGQTAFGTLAAGNNDIALHLLVLVVYGAVTFGIGYVLFRRRIADR